MIQPLRTYKGMYWLTTALLVTALAVGVGLYVIQRVPGPTSAHARENHPGAVEPAPPAPQNPDDASAVPVDVVRPQKGLDYTIEQPGSVHAFKTVDLRARVSGFLKEQTVDIGDRVKEGQVLAVLDVPELQKALEHTRASLLRAQASVEQMKARVTSAKADRDAAQAGVEQADAAYKSASAWVRFRAKQYQRIKDLFASQSIEERLVDESKERYEASLETERSAKAAIATSRANVAAAAAKIEQAVADVAGAESEVKVARADVEKAQVLVNFATIPAPFDGKVTHRNFFEKDFIRAASEGGLPLLTVQRTDLFRVVVHVPDTAVPYLDKGDPAEVIIDSLPGRKFAAKVSRVAGSEDPNTRLMQVEIDLANPTGEISDGMYGKVKILLDRFPNALSLPTSCVTRSATDQPAVWVVHDGRAHRVEVKLGKDNEHRVCILKGLRETDQVVLNPPAGLVEGAEVEPRVIEERRGEEAR